MKGQEFGCRSFQEVLTLETGNDLIQKANECDALRKTESGGGEALWVSGGKMPQEGRL